MVENHMFDTQIVHTHMFDIIKKSVMHGFIGTVVSVDHLSVDSLSVDHFCVDHVTVRHKCAI